MAVAAQTVTVTKGVHNLIRDIESLNRKLAVEEVETERHLLWSDLSYARRMLYTYLEALEANYPVNNRTTDLRF